MAYQHPRLAAAIGWKWNHMPGMCTSNGWLTAWPKDQPYPSDAQLAQWVAEYEALPADDPAKDARAALLKQVQQATTIQDLKTMLIQWIQTRP